MVKNIGERDEDQTRPLLRLHAVGKACRQDNKSRNNRDKCIQQHHVDGLPEKRALLPDVAPEDRHRADSDT